MADDEITLHLATPYISCEQALVTLEREILPPSFADAERAARAEWNVRLGRLRVGTLEESALRTFTSCLYRAQLHPNSTDEDNGEMSCWYLLAAMGLYQICPGKPEYSLTAPLFEEIVLEPEDAEPLRIIATGASRNARFLASAELNGEPLEPAVEYDSLRRGGVLSHTLSRVPQIGDGRPDGPGAASGRTPG